MIFVSYVRLARSGLQHDAFKAARCPGCRKAELVLDSDGKSVTCQGCGEQFLDGRLVAFARSVHCSQCRRMSGLWSGDGLVRCWRCHVKWQGDGRPSQVSRGLVNLTYAMPLKDLLFDCDPEAMRVGLESRSR